MKRGGIVLRASVVFGAFIIILDVLFIIMHKVFSTLMGEGSFLSILFFFLSLSLLWPYLIALATKDVILILFGIFLQIFYFMSLGYFFSKIERK